MAAPQDMLIAVMLAGIAIVLLSGIVLGRVARSLRQPVVIGEIVAGIVLGPSVLGQLPGDLPHRLFPADVRPLLSAVSQIGLVLFMFLVGWEFEKKLIRPHVRLATGVSLTSIALAFGLGVGGATLLYPRHATVAGQHISFVAFATFMGTAMSVTAFPVLARILSDNKLLGTRVGSVALAGAAIDDVLAWCMLAFVSALVSSGGHYDNLLWIALRSVGFVALLLLVVRPLLARLVWRWASAERWSSLLVLLCAGVFLSAWVTTWIGIHPMFGAFLFGLMMPREPTRVLTEHLRRPMNHLTLVLLPVFFIVTGLGVDLGTLTGADYWQLALIITIACAGKTPRRDRPGAAGRVLLAGVQGPRTADEHPRADRAGHPERGGQPRRPGRTDVHHDGDHGAGHHGPGRPAAVTAGDTRPRPSARNRRGPQGPRTRVRGLP
ncbi:cation:proton antiporter [Streptacidiphilus sp. PAMC 29251]